MTGPLDGCDPVGFVPVGDLDRAAAFYLDVLALAERDRSPFALAVTSGAIMIRITPVPDHRPSGSTVLGWEVADIAASVRALGERGVVFTRYPGMDQDGDGVWTSPSGAKVAWFAAPDGNVLSLTEAAR